MSRLYSFLNCQVLPKFRTLKFQIQYYKPWNAYIGFMLMYARNWNKFPPRQMIQLSMCIGLYQLVFTLSYELPFPKDEIRLNEEESL